MAFYLIMNQKGGGETFVTRKITRGISRILLGLDECLFLGNSGCNKRLGSCKRLC